MRLALVTPTYRGDALRLQVLCESIRRLGIEIPHFVIAETEDFVAVAELVREYQLTLLPTAAVLPSKIERRRANHYRRRDPRRWTSGRPIPGWRSQQLVKLAAAMELGSDVVVCVDSDTAFVRQVTAADFVAPSGEPFLFESVDNEAMTMWWFIEAARVLGVDLGGLPLRQYIHQPVVLNAATVRGLDSHLKAKRGLTCLEALLKYDTAEYPLYGVYARNLDDPAQTVPHDPLPYAMLWSLDQAKDGLRAWLQAVTEDRVDRPKMIGVQSTTGLPVGELLDHLRDVWTSEG